VHKPVFVGGLYGALAWSCA